jgi:ubiquitin C-terminal hydrolase
MNLNKNPRLENIEISENKDFTDFFNKIVDEIFNEIKPNEVKKSILDLKNTEEQSLFKEVSANFIKRSSLNEPRFSHEIKEK